MDDADDIEYALLNKREVMIYQIPPASSSSGHKAEDWKACIWRGRCRVVGKGKDLTIRMLDPSTSELFAQCLIPNGDHEHYVERVVDSSRYFVLKITNGARHAFIGLGFEDRNDAFDFNCALSDFKATWDRDKAPAPVATNTDDPARNLSLKEGETIKINIGGLGGKKREVKSEVSSGFPSLGGFPAPPPPGSASRRQAPSAQTAVAAQSASAIDDGFGDFGDFTSASAPAPAPAPSRPLPLSGAFGGASSFEVGALSSQLGQLNLGASSSNPLGMWPQAPAPAAQQPQPDFVSGPCRAPAQSLFSAPSQDMFSGPSLVPPQNLFTMPSAAPGGQATKAQAPKARDPFDEFDIFK